MAVITEKQQEVLDQLKDAKALYDKVEADLLAKLLDDKWEAKADIRRLVREAREEGVPYRQLGFILGTSDHKTITDYEQNIRRK